MQRPNCTLMSNFIFDFAPKMTERELRVCIALAYRQGQRTSIELLEEMTGLSRNGVQDGISYAVSIGLIEQDDVY